jgi:hypothetical protein
MIDQSTSMVARQGIVMRRIGDETILVPISAGVGDLDAVYTLSEVGATVWSLLQQPSSIGDIVAALCAQYDVSFEAASSDVVEFLDQLLEKKLVEPSRGREV